MDTPSYTDFTSADDFFEAVRQASREAERTRLTLLQMEAREAVRAEDNEAAAWVREHGGLTLVGTCSLCGNEIELWPYMETYCQRCLVKVDHSAGLGPLAEKKGR